jgi:hypothetical protein
VAPCEVNGKGSDVNMLTRLRAWIGPSDERKRERAAQHEHDYGHLSDQEKHEVARLREEHKVRGFVSDDSADRPGT